VGISIEDAIYVAMELERSAMYQWMARTIGKIDPPTEQEKRELIEFNKRWIGKGYSASRLWDYYEFILKK
jgi:ribulose-5-phosphate 4-epimerase/fuculose-1-phosphate aldolase